MPLVEQISVLEPEMQKLSDEQLQELVQTGMVLRNSSRYRTAALELLTLPTPSSSIQ